MVQLKELEKFWKKVHHCVSIPYGTIKRLCEIHSIFKSLLFQFLMVQLKVLLLL